MKTEAANWGHEVSLRRLVKDMRVYHNSRSGGPLQRDGRDEQAEREQADLVYYSCSAASNPKVVRLAASSFLFPAT